MSMKAYLSFMLCYYIGLMKGATQSSMQHALVFENISLKAIDTEC